MTNRQSDNRFEQLDRSVIEYLVSCEVNGTRFFISDNAPINSATDSIERARRFRDDTDAALFARSERKHRAWQGRFDWDVLRYFPTTGAALTE